MTRVVGEQDENRVVELVHVAQPVDEPADLVVGVVEEGGERLLQTCGEPLLCVGEVVPCLHAGVAGSKRGVGIDHAEFDLAVEPLLRTTSHPAS